MLQAVHPDDLVLELYCMKKLEGEKLDVFEDHLLVCDHCQDRVSETDSFVRGMKFALAAPEPELSVSRWNLKHLFQFPAPVWATAAMATAGVAAFFVSHNTGMNKPPLALALSATRGGVTPTAKSGRVLDLDLDARDLAPATDNRVQVVNSEGREVWSGKATSVQSGHIHALVKSALDPGQYYVRITDSRGTHREYAMRVGN